MSVESVYHKLEGVIGQQPRSRANALRDLLATTLEEEFYRGYQARADEAGVDTRFSDPDVEAMIGPEMTEEEVAAWLALTPPSNVEAPFEVDLDSTFLQGGSVDDSY